MKTTISLNDTVQLKKQNHVRGVVVKITKIPRYADMITIRVKDGGCITASPLELQYI